MIKKNVSILLTREEKARLLISSSLTRFSVSALIISLVAGLIGPLPILQPFFQKYPLFILAFTVICSFITFGSYFYVSYFGLYRGSLKSIKIVYWLSNTLITAISLGAWTGFLKAGDYIDINGIFLSLIAPALIFAAAGLITRYTKIDFTKLDGPLLILGLSLFIFILISHLFLPYSDSRERVLSVILVIFYCGVILSDLSMMKKHSKYIEIMGENDGVFGNEEERFSYFYSSMLLISFVRLVQLFLRLNSKR